MPDQTSPADQFSALALEYDRTQELPFVRYLETPGVLPVIGDVTGRSVLDVGCGSGLYTRLLKRMGARRVVGLDRSAGMVDHARAVERDAPLGVEYVLRDAADTAGLGPFDLVFGAYVLPYADTVAHLRSMCAGLAAALAPGRAAGHPRRQRALQRRARLVRALRAWACAAGTGAATAHRWC
mgnify:CR=1 FL=1